MSPIQAPSPNLSINSSNPHISSPKVLCNQTGVLWLLFLIFRFVDINTNRGLRWAQTLLNDNTNKSRGWQGGELNWRPLPPTCPALICPLPQRSPSLPVCQKPGLVVFFVSFESQPSVCSFNCAQTPFPSGESGRGGLIWAVWLGGSVMTGLSGGSVKPVWANRVSLTKVNQTEINGTREPSLCLPVQVLCWSGLLSVAYRRNPAQSTPLRLYSVLYLWNLKDDDCCLIITGLLNGDTLVSFTLAGLQCLEGVMGANTAAAWLADHRVGQWLTRIVYAHMRRMFVGNIRLQSHAVLTVRAIHAIIGMRTFHTDTRNPLGS